MFEQLLDKQSELMSRVPHTLREESFVKMYHGMKIISALLNYLNSTGHKPWRPEPLSEQEQFYRLQRLTEKVNELTVVHHNLGTIGIDCIDHDALDDRKLVSGFGIIEESIELLESTFNVNGADPSREHRLEELTDILFFWLEQAINNGFNSKLITDEYHRKHAVNLARYEALEKGDTSWDHRDKGVL